MPQPEILVARGHEKFDDDGRLTDEKTRTYLGKYLAALAEWTARVSEVERSDASR
jgi:chromate reductase